MKKKKFGQVPALLLLEAIYIMLQIALAVNYLYESGVMDCDSKWRAPEVFEDEENRDKDTKSSGVYSFGIIFFVVLNRKVPTNVLQSICDTVRLGFPDVE
ncbi:unnamed protein product [Sphagnum jensenii]